jgi:hypothetical protein
MTTDQRDTKGQPAARGLRVLTWPQVEALDLHIAAVIEAGFGEVAVVIKRGKPLFVSPRPSLRLSPARAEGG